MLLNSNSFQQRRTRRKQETFNHFSLRGTHWNLPSSNWATWHHAVFARPLLGSENSWPNTTLPAVATDSTLEANLRLHLLLACLCRSTCSVLSESICRKHVRTRTKWRYTIHLKPIQVYTNSYDNFTKLTMLLNSNNFQQRQTHPDQNKKTFANFSLRGTRRNLPSSNWATLHYELFARPLLGSPNSDKTSTLPAGTTDSKLAEDLVLHLLLLCHCRSTCSVLSESIRLYNSPWDCDKCRCTVHLKPIQVNLDLYDSCDNFTNLYKSEPGQHPTHWKRTRKPLSMSLCEARCESCLLQVEPLGITDFLPCCCGDLITVGQTQLFQQGRLTQRLKQICGSICSFCATAEAPAVFCQNQSVYIIHRGTATSAGVQSILNPSQLGLVWLIRQLHKYIQIWTRTTSNTDKEALKKTGKPLRISLYEALAEICLLQVEPLGTMQFLPGPCWDLRTVDEKQLFQERRLAQGFKQICSCICTLRPPAEAPALFCQNQSVKNTLRQR